VIGVRNLRGQVLPVVDLAAMLGLEADSEAERVVVAEGGERRAGFAVRSVEGVEHLPDAHEEAESEYLHGAALVDGALVGIVKVDALLDTLATPESE
jgi:purine-binding chemotaxis protein CheW